MPFIPENELERALVAAAHDSGAAPAFYRLLLDSDLLVLGTVEGQEEATETVALEPGGRINLVPGEKDGSRYLPVFSSLTRMQDYVTEESKYLRINGRALLDLTRGAPVTLNPASEYGKELTADQVGQLLDSARIVPRIVESQAEPPVRLVEALTHFFTARPDIQAAWITMVAPSGRAEEAHPLVGIETSGDWPSMMQGLQEVARDAPDSMFDVQRVDRFNPVGMAAALLQSPPFYQRRFLN
ncbi:MAG TPA: enhanced serine sensitivity protein SseB C-terminal domain-containing protein [Rhizomicrobium sp.]|nr:enhanced serine sensitivity protein SseB C-terminal domain-containing protein [Rhizomicrobium sp.]